jgi:hypothetical protein
MVVCVDPDAIDTHKGRWLEIDAWLAGIELMPEDVGTRGASLSAVRSDDLHDRTGCRGPAAIDCEHPSRARLDRGRDDQRVRKSERWAVVGA